MFLLGLKFILINHLVLFQPFQGVRREIAPHPFFLRRVLQETSALFKPIFRVVFQSPFRDSRNYATNFCPGQPAFNC